jgi:hypothetical protein
MRATRTLRVASVLLTGVALACATAPEVPEPAPEELPETPEPAPPWTATFMDEAVLMAEVVRIEGPPGLREHFALVQDNDHHIHEVKTTPEGLLQKTALKSDVTYLAPIRCQLDKLTIVAERQLIVLERPAHVPVSVKADGDVFFKRTASGEEQRSATLRIVGRPE